MKKRILAAGSAVLAACVLGASLYGLNYYHLLPEKEYTAGDFGIGTHESGTDGNGNGTDDYGDILLGARAYLSTRPKHVCRFYAGGYPPAAEGMGSDVVWKAFQSAGYSLKDLVDRDIAANVSAYPAVNGRPDPDVDFRRVRNLLVFFQRRAESLTVDRQDIREWQPGDIVIFSTGEIGIVSDKRNKDGVPYLLHNDGQPVFEEDAMDRYEAVEGHFRWNPAGTADRLTG